jgi:hypothetical protein
VAETADHTPGHIRATNCGLFIVGAGNPYDLGLPYLSPWIEDAFIDTYKLAAANTERLALCWNSHDELLAALELYLTQHKGASPSNTPCMCFICGEARAAIAKAKEGKG